MTLTPPPNTITYQQQQQGHQQQQQQQGHLDDKENSNIQAALDGIRAMKEVLSRKNSHEGESVFFFFFFPSSVAFLDC